MNVVFIISLLILLYPAAPSRSVPVIWVQRIAFAYVAFYIVFYSFFQGRS